MVARRLASPPRGRIYDCSRFDATRRRRRARTRFAALRRRGVGKRLAAQTASSAHGPWRISHSPGTQHRAAQCPLRPDRPRIRRRRPCRLTPSNRRVRTRTHGGVGGAEPRGSPLSRFRCGPSGDPPPATVDGQLWPEARFRPGTDRHRPPPVPRRPSRRGWLPNGTNRFRWTTWRSAYTGC